MNLITDNHKISNYMNNKSIKLNGSHFTILILHLLSCDLTIVKCEIEKKINQLPNLFKNAPIVLNVADLPNNVDWISMQKVITSTGLYIVGVINCNDNVLKKKIIASGLPFLYQNNKQFFEKKIFNTFENFNCLKQENHNSSLIVNTPIRSGQKIYAKNRDLIITNYVSSGAEIIADGNVHIYGTMKGRVLAGANGDASRQIFCTQFFSELISIAGEYLVMEYIPVNYLGKSVIIFLNNQSLKIKLIK